MNTCDRARGELFLTGSLTSVEEQRYTEHLEQCPCCRDWLEEAAAEPESWRMARELSTGDVWELRTSDFLADEPFAQKNHRGIDIAQQVIPYLSPTDDPAMLGRLGAYEVIGVIGRGGMGIVLKGFDALLRRNVAIKILDPALATVGVARQRFGREARAMAAISHEHVMPIYGVDEHQGLPYFVMEYVAGGTLEHRIHQQGTLDTIATARIALQVSEALAAAHQQGLVHRDIKPGNILVDAGTERVRVADFGLAQIASDTSQTRSGMITGTPQFMSPEQVRGETCDARSDLFSLGSVIYAMCVGHAPFRAPSLYAVMQRIVHDEVKPLRTVQRAAPEWLDRLVVKLLEKSPSARFDSAEEVAGILRAELAYLQNPAQIVPPTRNWYPQQRSADSHRTSILVIAMALVLGLGILGGGGVAWQAIHWAEPVVQDGVPTSAITSDPNGLPKSAVSDVRASQDAARASTSAAFASGPSRDDTAPLWGADGWNRTASEIDDVEQRWRGSRGLSDTWTHEVQALERQMLEFSSDPGF